MLCPTVEEYDRLLKLDMSKMSQDESDHVERLIHTFEATHEGDDEPATKERPHVKCHGDSAGGYIVEVHDGEQHHTFGVDAESDTDAVKVAMRDYREKTAPPAEGESPLHAKIAELEAKIEALAAKIAA